MSKVFVQGTSGMFAGQKIPVEGEIIIGRDPKACNIIFPNEDKSISGSHCRISVINGMPMLTDLKSTNGTFLSSGMRLQPNSSQTIHNGESFYLGTPKNTFFVLVEEDSHQMVEQNVTGANVAGETVDTKMKLQKNKNIMIIASVAVAIVCIVVGVAIFSVQSSKKEAEQAEQARIQAEQVRMQAEQARIQMEEQLRESESQRQQIQSELDAEQNKGIIDQTFDTVKNWWDILH